jgi:methionyl aminopeptidase
MDKQEIDKIRKAGKISVEIKEYARTIIKKDMLLLEIAEKIEEKIKELGAKPAFPTNLSINEIAAHSTPSFNDTEKAKGLLKVDFGCHIDGFISDTAFSIDLENNEENKKLIESAESALKKATEKINKKIKLKEIGEIIDSEIKKAGFTAIRNLSGHQIEKYDLHAGLTIPNFNNQKEDEIEEGLYAIEPFATKGIGLVKDGKPSGIYQLRKPSQIRDNFAREILEFIIEEYNTLPFCSRWIYSKFNARGLLALRQLEQAEILYQYPQLIEKSKEKVSQAEHTILITQNEKIITTQ